MPAQNNIRASTQEHLDINEIQDNLVILKNNCCVLVLKTTAINFGLLSEKEQEATIFAYAGFLNSLTFPIQLLIHSRQKDISAYLDLIDQQTSLQSNEKLKEQLKKYRLFVESTVIKNKVLDKKFYVIISYNPYQSKRGNPRTLLEKAKVDLHPKRDHLISQFQRLGLQAKQLTSQELIELFYGLYNPESEGQKFVGSPEYQTPIVEAVISPPAPPTTPIEPAPYNPRGKKDLNILLPKKPGLETNQPPEGGRLQKQIENIVQKVTAKKNDSQS